MPKTLLIYDNTGIVYFKLDGGYIIPNGGIQYLEIEIPTGKMVTGVDVRVTPNLPIYEYLPLSETDLLKQQVAELETALVEVASLVGGTV